VAIWHANTYRIKRKVSRDCPQGSCSCPGLWNVMYDALLNLEYSTNSKIIAFADDLVILTYGNTQYKAEAFANSDLARIEIWASENKMKFNESKSKVTLITRKRIQDDINILLNNRRLVQVKVIKYLGIHFDSKLTFHSHIDYISEKSRKLVYMLSETAKLN
jgi:hypothetical protein